MTTFDFGCGPVPAHRHKNPNGTEGGWVAGTARVSDTARVADNATVTGSATVTGNAWVMGSATVTGSARVADNATVTGSARVTGGYWVESPPQMQCGRWIACLSAPGVVSVGCQTHSLGEWGTVLDRLADEYGATDYEVALIRAFLSIAADVDAAGIGREP